MAKEAPLMGITGEHHDAYTGTLSVPCKNGYIRVYFNDITKMFTVYFPTPIASGKYSFSSYHPLDIKLLVDDYLSKEPGRSETKEVPLPRGVTDGP